MDDRPVNLSAILSRRCTLHFRMVSSPLVTVTVSSANSSLSHRKQMLSSSMMTVFTFEQSRTFHFSTAPEEDEKKQILTDF